MDEKSGFLLQAQCVGYRAVRHVHMGDFLV